MIKFEYKGYDSAGTPVRGEITAESEQSASAELQAKNVLVESLRPQQSSSVNRFLKRGIGFSDIEFLTSELSILLASGVKVDKALALLAKARLKPELNTLISDISQSLKGGQSLADAFAKYPKYFDGLYVTLLRLGEESGELPSVLRGLASDMKFKRQLRAKVIQASVYPLVILFVCIASVFFIFNYIVPQMSSMFEGRDNLPGYTQLVLGLSEWLQNYQVYLLIGLVALGFLFYSALKNAAYRSAIHQWLLNLPLLSTLIRMTERIRFCAGSALMLSAGLSVDRVLKLVAGTISNTALRLEVEHAWQRVRQGTPLAEALSHCRVMDDFYISLLEIGEESGELERVFAEIAERSREEFEANVTKFTNLLEPVLILTMGLLVGGVVVTLILSIVSVTSYG